MVTGDTLGIGDLARRTGVPVRTIRFYCDEGLLAPARSVGGHRRFDPTAVGRLNLVRRLRGLGLGLKSITDVLTGQRSLADTVAAERAALDREVAALAWRRSVLRAVEEAPPTDRAARLELLCAVADGFAAHDVLVRLWRPMTTGPIPPDTARMFLDISAPRPPELPTPAQVVAYAELVLLATDRALATRLRASTLVDHDRIADLGALHAAVGAACELAFPQVAVGARPQPGPALDLFVAAHAAALGTGDTPGFRRALNRRTAADRHPRLRRYWHLAGEITGEPAPVGVTHTWLLDALDRSVSRGSPAASAP
ncbi:Cu(I)-responsive transcriptional regulator [Actinokineospora spheciospongiae]|uniref:Cu(I)-responsive transcriptional regulator n=1 Tax=Actinokineospora spheciospongiae TaxID=909613 RepID=W7IMS8_9PSEU|nr:MerR family transcriptional regulator [Actinokineospora spheciospongiae]EWC61693.1 Cu(I)-responsive transcriptional regulator [Actinokineospora spheciospongiae]